MTCGIAILNGTLAVTHRLKAGSIGLFRWLRPLLGCPGHYVVLLVRPASCFITSAPGNLLALEVGHVFS
jgi:hypothetical protein